MQRRRFTKGPKRPEPFSESDLFEEAQLLPKRSPVKAVAYREKLALDNGSIDSSEFSSNPSFGSCDEVDSYINASISGLISEEDVSSHLPDDPAYANAKPCGNHKNNGKIMRGLPRFTVNSTRTRALLGAQPVFQKRKTDTEYMENSTSSSLKTPPLTPNSSEIISVYSHKKGGVVNDELVLGEQLQELLIIPSNQISNSIRIKHSSHVTLSGDVDASSGSSSLDPIHHTTTSTNNTKEKIPHTMMDQYSKAALEVEFWKEILMTRVSRFGPHDLDIAKGLNELGAAHIRNKQYTEALAVYKKAARILRQHYGDQSLAVAHALDKVGLAASLCPTTESIMDPISTSTSSTASSFIQHCENLEWGLIALKEAFKIRMHYLGPWHVDVVDTLNNLAGIHLRRNEKEKAYDAYLQVLTVRIAIFGKNHASVAVTAQILGTLSMSMSNFNQAMNYFKVCLRIYKRGMNLKDGHPLVQQTFKRIDKTQQLMSCMNVGLSRGR